MTDASYIIRNYQPADFEGYVQLCRESEELRPSGHPVTPEIAAAWLDWPYYSPGKDLFLAELDGELVGGLDLRPEPDINRVILRCWIKPEHRRRGLAGRLFSQALRRIRELGAGYVHTNISEGNKTARLLLAKSGFKPVRRYLEMRIDITRLDKHELERAAGNCRCIEPCEEMLLARLQNRAFAGQWGYNPNTAESIAYYTRLGGFSPDKIICICRGDKIAGYCWLEMAPSTADDSEREGLIHMLGADPDYRGKGIGRKALLAGLDCLMKKGVKTASLSVDSANRSARNLYRSLGFERRAKSLWYEKEID